MIIIYEKNEKEKIKKGEKILPLKIIYLDDEDNERLTEIDRMAFLSAKNLIKNGHKK